MLFGCVYVACCVLLHIYCLSYVPFWRRCPLLTTTLSTSCCLLSLLFFLRTCSRFDLVWFCLCCDDGWIRSGSVNVRKIKNSNQRGSAALIGVTRVGDAVGGIASGARSLRLSHTRYQRRRVEPLYYCYSIAYLQYTYTVHTLNHTIPDAYVRTEPSWARQSKTNGSVEPFPCVVTYIGAISNTPILRFTRVIYPHVTIYQVTSTFPMLVGLSALSLFCQHEVYNMYRCL